MKTHHELGKNFKVIGESFLQLHLQGFLSRKPKKIIKHTRAVLRFYRNHEFDSYTQLVGTILVWRYAMLRETGIPKRERIRIEQSIVRSFNHLLQSVGVEEIESVQYLRSETTPDRSVMMAGNPLRKLLDLKIIEHTIRFRDYPMVKENVSGELLNQTSDQLEKLWRSSYFTLTQGYRFRIPFSTTHVFMTG